jgi:benzoate-CoA ligase family protein
MQDNTVFVDEKVDPPTLNFAPSFNVAVPFIDRHLDEGRAEKDAIRPVDESVTYGQLAERVNQCGNLFKTLGIGQGDRILMYVKDCPEFFYAFFGAVKAGFIPVPVNTMLRTDDYRYLIENSKCTVMVHSADFSETAAEALSQSSHKPAHVMTAEGPDGMTGRMAEQSTSLDAAAATAMDDCFWLYSSGSTGYPKGVVHAHRDMVCTGHRVTVQTHDLNDSDSFFSASKLFHSYGFGNALTFPLWVGGTALLSDQRVSPAMTFELIEKLKPTAFYGVPTLYAQQLQALETTKPDLSSLRACLSAGEALPGDVFRRWKETTGLSILDGRGSTEMLHMFVANSHDNIKPGTSGRAIPGYEVKIVDEELNPVAQGEIGVLLAKGESNAKYYWDNPEKTATTMLGEWLNTGDTYYQDEDGCYVYCGRGDDMLKVGGLWCAPFEIEACLIEHPKVLEAAVVGRADDEGLIKPEAWVVLNNHADGVESFDAELREHCRDSLDHYKYPRWFNFVEDLPKTATGKIQRFKLRQ